MASVESTSPELTVLGYVSLAQLEERVTQSNPGWSKTSCRLASLGLFMDVIRMGVPTVGAEYDASASPNDTFGDGRLLDADAFKRMLESGELTHPYTYPLGSGIVVPKGLSSESKQLAAGFLEERANFLLDNRGDI